MLDWNEYIEQLLSRESSLDGINLSLGETTQPVGIPPIIKASILMLDKMLERQGNFNILVFPERIQSIFIFTLVKLLYNISEGRIERDYDPEKFQLGDKLKFGKAVAEFLGIEEENGKQFMCIRFSDLDKNKAPIEFFPFFQKTNAKALSKYEKFAQEKKAIKAPLNSVSAEAKYLRLLTDYKTHMDSSIVNMTTVMAMKEQINNCELLGRKVKDLILIGQADYEGNVKNIGAGQLGGTPAIVMASDLYQIAEMAQKGHPIQSIIIDGSNANSLISQLDALDDLMRIGVPITCVTDIVNSFDLQPFLDRKFNLWRWDETSITDKLFDAVPLAADQKAKHCAKREIEYLLSNGNEISTAIRKLSFTKRETQDFSTQMLKMVDRLYALAFTALREIVPPDNMQLMQYCHILDECDTILKSEKNYILEKIYDEYCIILACLRAVFTKGYVLPKHDSLAEKLRYENYRSVGIIVPERTDKKRIQMYWQMWCRRKMLRTQIYVLSPEEYYSVKCTQFSATIVVGWFRRAIMRKILYSFNTQSYTVLLYDCEKGWKNFTTAKWDSILDSSQNRQVIEKSFANDTTHISTTRFKTRVSTLEDIPKTDEYEEIELILRENKNKQYIIKGSQEAVKEPVEAIPVNFVGGYLAFYQTGHRILSATNIIVNDADRIKEEDKKLPANLNLGDFVVVRETGRDIIKELADIILENSGKTDCRKLASGWKDALVIEKIFFSNDQIYANLVAAGCKKGQESVYRWLNDEDIIAPQDKEDLQFIAKVTGNLTMMEMLDQIYDAAQIVRRAHSKAGRILSETLKARIVQALDEYGDIDPFNIWEPIEMQVEGIGTVRILKIIDIGTPVIVDKSDTNHLIEEE